jgi:NitT/TauT family transport system ATP-binding protein
MAPARTQLGRCGRDGAGPVAFRAGQRRRPSGVRAVESIRAHKDVHGGVAQPLPAASVHQIEALMEALTAPAYDGHAELATLARGLVMRIDDLLPTAETLHILEFGEIKDGALSLTAAGRAFAQATGDVSKRLFAEHLLRFVPLAAHVERVLNERPGHRAPTRRFQAELEDHLHPRDAERTLRTLVAWGRYAEMLTFDHRSRTISAFNAPEQSSS